EQTVAAMRPGSVVVDLAIERGGNCPLSRADEIVQVGGVTLLAPTNLPALLPGDASALYARNLLDFLKLITADGTLAIQREDDIVAACLMCEGGKLTREA